jgi:hypothetical protein
MQVFDTPHQLQGVHNRARIPEPVLRLMSLITAQ